MFPSNENILVIIPESLCTKALNATLDVIVRRGEELLNEEILAHAAQLSSDDTFGLAFEAALQRAADRFVLEYLEEDEDLVTVIAEDEAFFKNRAVQEALLKVLSEPVRYLEGEEDEEAQAIVSQSFATLFPRRRNRKRVRRAVHFLLKCIVSEVWRLPDLGAAYEALAEHYRRSLAAEKVYHNLPRPDYQRFVGRKKEQAELHQLLSPQSRHFVITIDGIGGIGKSALALEVAHQHRQGYGSLPQSERFDALIWATAKQSILTSQGIQRYNHTFRALDDIYTTIASALQREDITRARREEQDEIVTEALSQQRTLLIIDNLETVDDTRIMNFIRNVPRPTKVIVTTRHRLNIAYPMRLVGMSQEEALELISNETNLKNVSLITSQAIRLYKRTGGVPLAIVWSIAQMSIKDDVEATLSRLSHPNSDIAQFCFQGAIELIRNSPAHKLLMALSLFATDASRDALGYVTNLPILDRDEGLEELERLSLVNKEGDRFALLPLTKAYSQSELGKDGELEESFRERWVGYLLDFVAEKHSHKHNTVEEVTPDLDNIIGAMDWCWQKSKLELLLTFMDKTDFYLWATGRWNTRNRFLELGLQAGQILKKELVEANYLRRQAEMADTQGDLTEALELIDRAIAIHQLYKPNYRLALSLFRLSAIQTKQKKWDLAQSTAKQALLIAQKTGNDKLIMRMEGRLGKIHLAQGDYQAAKYHLNRALNLNKNIPEYQEEDWSAAWLYRMLGQVLLGEQNHQLSKLYLESSLQIAQRIKNKQETAETKLRLAELQLAMGDLNNSQQTAKEAIKVFRELGMKLQEREIQALLAQIAAQWGQP